MKGRNKRIELYVGLNDSTWSSRIIVVDEEQDLSELSLSGLLLKALDSPPQSVAFIGVLNDNLGPEPFEEFLKRDRDEACKQLADAKVEEWMNEGADEVKRCLTLWMQDRRDLSDDDTLLAIAEGASYL